MGKGKKMLGETENLGKKGRRIKEICLDRQRGQKWSFSSGTEHSTHSDLIPMAGDTKSRKRGLNAWNLKVNTPAEPVDNGTG